MPCYYCYLTFKILLEITDFFSLQILPIKSLRIRSYYMIYMHTSVYTNACICACMCIYKYAYSDEQIRLSQPHWFYQ